MRLATFIFIILLVLNSCQQLVNCSLTIHSDMPGKQLVDGQKNVIYTDHVSMYVDPTDTVTISNLELIGAPAGLEVHFSETLSSSDTYFFVFTGTPIESGNFIFQISYTSNIQSDGHECSRSKMSEDFYLNIQP